MRMFESGMEGERLAANRIGATPEWFYKGNGSIVRSPFEPLTVPSYAEDGGEEAEVAGVYIIAEDGRPYRIGMCAANEFSDHNFERHNYLNLAGSKLRECSLGPELVIGGAFQSVRGEAAILRSGVTIWKQTIETGEEHMTHSLANLEHHHFKFAAHRTPGHVHVHFFGAYSLSFADGIQLQEGDMMSITYEGFGRPLCNPLHRDPVESERLVAVQVIC